METEPTATARPAGVSVRALCALGAVALAAYVLDQVTKYLVIENLRLGESVEVLGSLLQFFFVKNPGAAFSLASGSTWIFSIAASLVAIFIVLFARRIRSMGWAVLCGMLLGGTLGNLTDRLLREPSFGLGHVIDFIQVAGFPAVFNIADIFIVSSMGLLIIMTIRGIGLDGSRTPKAGSSAPVSTPAERSLDDETPSR